jgi:hypothetical protein
MVLKLQVMAFILSLLLALDLLILKDEKNA